LAEHISRGSHSGQPPGGFCGWSDFIGFPGAIRKSLLIEQLLAFLKNQSTAAQLLIRVAGSMFEPGVLGFM
jgi:hypothetical protein